VGRKSRLRRPPPEKRGSKEGEDIRRDVETGEGQMLRQGELLFLIMVQKNHYVDSERRKER